MKTLFNTLSKDELIKILENIEDKHIKEIDALDDEISYLNRKHEIEIEEAGIYDSAAYDWRNKVDKKMMQLYIVDPRYRTFIMNDSAHIFEYGLLGLLKGCITDRIRNPIWYKIGHIYYVEGLKNFKFDEKYEMISELCWEVIEELKYPDLHEKIWELLDIIDISVYDLWDKGSYNDDDFIKMVKEKLEKYSKNI